MTKPKKWVNISIPPEVLERLKPIPGYSYRKKVEWLLNISDNQKNNAVTKMTYDELVEYTITQSKSQDKTKVLGLIVGLLRCFL